MRIQAGWNFRKGQLTDLELRYLLRALDHEQSLFAPLIRLLILTGQRRAEVAGMRWSELRDLDSGSPLWEIPGNRTKNKHAHLVPLSTMVSRLLSSLPRVGDLVFTTTGDTPMSGFGKVKARLDARIDTLRNTDSLSPMAPWTLHDLRRTMVTVMNEKLGISPHIVEAVVNHTSGLAKAGVAGVYNRALYLEDRRQALNSWQDWISHVGKVAPGTDAGGTRGSLQRLKGPAVPACHRPPITAGPVDDQPRGKPQWRARFLSGGPIGSGGVGPRLASQALQAGLSP
jgi:integrase